MLAPVEVSAARERQVDGGRHTGCTIVTNSTCTRHDCRLQDHELAAVEALVWPPGREGCLSRELWGGESLQCGCAGQHPQWGRAGLIQRMNGPCGALAAIQARLVALRLAAGPNAQHAELSLLAEAVACCLQDAAADNSAASSPQLCRIVVPGTLRIITAEGPALRAALLDTLTHCNFGPSELLLSLVATRGTDRVAAELRRAGEPCLVAGDSEAVANDQVGFCTESLLTLCLAGTADGAVRTPILLPLSTTQLTINHLYQTYCKNIVRPVRLTLFFRCAVAAGSDASPSAAALRGACCRARPAGLCTWQLVETTHNSILGRTLGSTLQLRLAGWREALALQRRGGYRWRGAL